ncbi:hypothetical protein [Streptomyces sp. V2I9]|uniref:hypothetical protein n=1 Tax=Streptomyces sp. V2I9 TaxID=3042304 RepID=UPI00277E48B9|nr:hypothetical protein [Streptomyces sp. V2I9]MDQ0987937.1 cystathionine beta-lyase/cystathionine gamma-synthase [Streptomyces sp. V2I9]
MMQETQRRVRFSKDLELLAPANDLERDALNGLLAALRTDTEEDNIRAAKLRLRDALLLSAWQSPVQGDRRGSGTLQGPSYESHYERESLDPDVLEDALSTDTHDALVFRTVDCARKAHAYAVGYIAANQPEKRDRLPAPEFAPLRVLDQEVGVLRLPAAGTEVLQHLARDVRKLGGALTFLQLVSAYLALEQLPVDSWCVDDAASGAATDVRPLRLRFTQAATCGRGGVVEECERVLSAAHGPYLAGAGRAECVLTASGMSALDSLLQLAVSSDTSVLVGKGCYPETGKLLKYIAHRCDVRSFTEDRPLHGIVPGDAAGRPKRLMVLLEPVSNCAATEHISEFTGWARSEARDLAVCDIPAVIRALGTAYGGGALVAVDASVSGPGPWLARVAEAAEESGVQVVLWSSLQKHFMAGEDWSPGGYLLNLVPTGSDPLFSSAELRGTVDLAGSYEPALRLVAACASGASARAERLGEAAAWIAAELAAPASQVLHPASPEHPEHDAWAALGRPAVPFVLLRLGPERAERVRTLLNAASPDLPEIVLRNSFGFAEPTVTEIFPGQPDEIMRLSPGDPELYPPAALLRALRAALADGGEARGGSKSPEL